ncbi:MAG: hypothetical protein AAGE03_04385 [Pseudomonadota bacterium]
MSDDVVRAAQARLSTAFPGWRDATGDAQATERGRLPAFAVSLTITDSERVGMGGDDWWYDGILTVGLRTEARDLDTLDRDDREAAALALSRNVNTAILGGPSDLDGAAWTIEPEGWEADHEKAEKSVAVVDVTFVLRLVGPAA